MSPSTSKPQDRFRLPDPGTWTCFLCQPNVHDKGDIHDLYRHYNREHLKVVTR